MALAWLLLLRDPKAPFVWPGLYAVGRIGVAPALGGGEPAWALRGWPVPLALGTFALAAALAARPVRSDAGPGWFLLVQAVLAGVVLIRGLPPSLGREALALRLAGPASVLLLTAAAYFMARGRPGGAAGWLHYATLSLGAVAAVEAGWAAPGVAVSGAWLHRTVWLMTALAGMTALYGVALPPLLPRGSAWWHAGRRLGPVLGSLAALVLLGVLVQEAWLFDRLTRRTPLAPPAVSAVALALGALIVAAVIFAVRPGGDPFRLSERGRTAYVYAAEVFLALLFLHLRLTVPEIFGGLGARYWALIVMAVSFAGVGLAEFFRRRQLPVLAEPLQRTGVFLPLLPLLAFWGRPAGAWVEPATRQVPSLLPLAGYLENLPHDFANHAVLWFLAGALYSAMALSRRSFRFTLLAAVATNLGLWSLLYHHGLAFWVHPQIWLIPAALIALAAEHVNHDRLSPAQSHALRYGALMTVYVSSSADMFIAGLGRSWVLPLVLTVLSVLGVLAGMLLRVRAFLFLGTTFLLFVITTMIWHAGVDQRQTWILWASGIVLGAAILALFGVFEKRRNDVLRLVEDLRPWR